MTSFSNFLKSEITRLAKKEARALVEPLRKANVSYRRDIAELKRQVTLLQRQVGAVSRTTAKATAPSADAKPTRFVAKGLRSLRARLGVSATDFGKLAGASGQSIYNWENGKAVPRKAQLAALAPLRSLSKKQAQARLLEQQRVTPKLKKRASKK
jgi:DNA-binding transcriptional regulator YiaG